tara:strand:+ start:206 stop:502 length:297 start_codon:yes stop_codon:yes gene_type:complete
MLTIIIRNLDCNNLISTFNIDNDDINCKELSKIIIDNYKCGNIGMDHPNNDKYQKVNFGSYIQGDYYPINERWGRQYLDFCKEINENTVWFYIHDEKF